MKEPEFFRSMESWACLAQVVRTSQKSYSNTHLTWTTKRDNIWNNNRETLNLQYQAGFPRRSHIASLQFIKRNVMCNFGPLCSGDKLINEGLFTAFSLTFVTIPETGESISFALLTLSRHPRTPTIVNNTHARKYHFLPPCFQLLKAQHKPRHRASAVHNQKYLRQCSYPTPFALATHEFLCTVKLRCSDIQ